MNKVQINSSYLHENRYLLFLKSSSKLFQASGLAKLKPNEQALFDEVCCAWAAGQPLSVTGAMSLVMLGSPTTLNKRLTRLRDKNFIEIYNFDYDKRSKYLVPTSKGLAYLDVWQFAINAVAAQDW